MLNTRFKPTLLATAVAATYVAHVAPAHAQEQSLYSLNIPAGTLAESLNALARQSKLNLSADAMLLKGHSAPAVSGRFSVEQALETILADLPLQATPTKNGGYSITALTVTALDTVQVKGRASRFGDAPVEAGGFKAEYQTTATKMAMPLKETPQAISVVTRDLLDARQAKDLSTAVETSASVSNSADGGGTRVGPGMFGGQGKYDQKFVLRGQPTPVRSDGFNVGNSNVDLSVYERVEVVKGPAGFYGQGGLGGFINMVRKKPQEEFEASITAQVGSFDTYRTELDVTGSLNEEQTIRGRLNFAYENADSFVDKLESERFVFAPSLEAIINDKTRVLAQFLYQKDRFDANPGVPLNLEGDQIKLFPLLSDPTRLYGNTGEKSDTAIAELLLRVDHELSDQWLLSLLMQKNRSTRDITNPSYAYVSGDYLYTSGGKDIWERDFWAGELRLQGEYEAFGETHQLLAGIDRNDQLRYRDWGNLYVASDYAFVDTYTGDFSEFTVFSQDDIPTIIARDVTLDNRAFYAQTVLSLSTNTRLLIGGRYDEVRQATVPTNGANYGNRINETAFTGKIGVSHTVNDNVTAYGIAAESFEPSWGESPEGPLPPITGKGYEIGIKTEWLDQKLGVNVSAYHQELTNRPLTDPDNNNFQIASGEHLTKGLELEVSGSPYPGWTLAMAYTLMDNEFTEDDDPNKGLSINGSVDQQLGLFATYEFREGALKGLGVGASYLNTGDRQFVDTSDADNYKQIFLDGYDRLDLTLTYTAIPNWDLNLLVRNVTDELYVESASSFLGEGNYFGSPRAVLLTAEYNF